MKLQRVQVPDFRVLKNVDISFEKDFVPNIFPLGSQQVVLDNKHKFSYANKIKKILFGFCNLHIRFSVF